MRDFCDKVLEEAACLGATYADGRIVRRRNESIETKNGKVEALSSDSDRGFGVRVIVDGAWGFASSSVLTEEEGREIAAYAVRIARASAQVQTRQVTLAPVEPVEGHFVMPCGRDPFDVPLEDKISLLMDADRLMRQQQEVAVAEGSLSFYHYDTIFASSEGTYVQQEKTESGVGIAATAIRGSEVQRRSFPAYSGGDFAAAGYEFVEDWQVTDSAERIAEEAVALLDAPLCPSGRKDIVLEGSMLALQVHESCGHPVELDRVFGSEASFAGTSFLTPEKLGKFRYGSDLVNITADATSPGGLGSLFFDDEGVPAQRTNIVTDGIFTGYLSSRETAAQLGTASSGAMRADGWYRLPIVRMTNVNLAPGDWELDEIIEDTKDGLFMMDVKCWSIDDHRLNFQFGQEQAYEIRDGQLGQVYKNPTYAGITYEFWRSCDAIAGEEDWHIWGVPGCGKGEPMQVAHVGHGVAPARFRNVQVGVMK